MLWQTEATTSKNKNIWKIWHRNDSKTCMVHIYLMHNGCSGLKHRCYAAQTEIAIFRFSTAAAAYFIINFPSIAMPFNSNVVEKVIFDKLISIYHVMSCLAVVCAMKRWREHHRANKHKLTFFHQYTHIPADRSVFFSSFFSFCLFCLFPTLEWLLHVPIEFCCIQKLMLFGNLIKKVFPFLLSLVSIKILSSFIFTFLKEGKFLINVRFPQTCRWPFWSKSWTPMLQ